MWFREIAASENPSRDELRMFVGNVRHFLRDVLDKKDDFSFLWINHPRLYDLASETFRLDVSQGAGLELDAAIVGISEAKLFSHGLMGRPLKFKLLVLDSIANQWEHLHEARDRWGRFRRQLSIREWFKKIIEAIDAVLDSLIDAAGGAGGLIKEFKDALSSLA